MSEKPVHPRHTGKQRLFLLFNIGLAVVTLMAGSGILYANWKLGNRKVVTIDTVDNSDTNLNLPAGDLSAKNFLVTGADDNTSCIPKSSRFYKGVGNRSNFGARTDSLMVIRVNPIDNQAAVLSFPRDLWVKQAGSTRSNRINANFDKKNPNRLIRTIKENFGIPIHHYVNVDFCTFVGIVEAVGGVRVPFPYKVKDRSGFRISNAPVCYNLRGINALFYMRARHYQWYDPAMGTWRADNTSDYGRISRQQDFLKRMIRKALDKSRTSPRVAASILNSTLKNVITDDKLSPLKVLQLGQAMKNFDAETMGSYTLPGTGTMIDDMSVILPDTTSTVSRNILAVFQGKASLSGTIKGAPTAPAANAATTTLAAAATASTAPAKSTTTTARTGTTVKGTTTTTVPTVAIDQATRGIVPPNDPTCQY